MLTVGFITTKKYYYADTLYKFNPFSFTQATSLPYKRITFTVCNPMLAIILSKSLVQIVSYLTGAAMGNRLGKDLKAIFFLLKLTLPAYFILVTL